MDNQHDNHNSFTTIIKEGFNTDQLRVPPKSLEYLNIGSLRNATLVGSSGDKWQVSVTKRGNGMYLQHGWPQFLKDNSVMQDEFLQFTYDGKKCFHVKIFGKNGCERPCSRKGRKLEPAKQEQTSADSLHLLEPKPTQEDATELLGPRNKGLTPKEYSSMPQISPEVERSNGCESADSFTSNNPWFKNIMVKSNVNTGNYLGINNEFARKYLPPDVRGLVLQNSIGKHWQVGVTCTLIGNGKYHRLSKGWKKFSGDNNLKIGDTCIFELEGGNRIRVHIFRCAPN